MFLPWIVFGSHSQGVLQTLRITEEVQYKGLVRHRRSTIQLRTHTGCPKTVSETPPVVLLGDVQSIRVK